jgi:hypothetical protein
MNQIIEYTNTEQVVALFSVKQATLITAHELAANALTTELVDFLTAKLKAQIDEVWFANVHEYLCIVARRFLEGDQYPDGLQILAEECSVDDLPGGDLIDEKFADSDYVASIQSVIHEYNIFG